MGPEAVLGHRVTVPKETVHVGADEAVHVTTPEALLPRLHGEVSGNQGPVAELLVKLVLCEQGTTREAPLLTEEVHSPTDVGAGAEIAYELRTTTGDVFEVLGA